MENNISSFHLILLCLMITTLFISRSTIILASPSPISSPTSAPSTTPFSLPSPSPTTLSPPPAPSSVTSPLPPSPPTPVTAPLPPASPPSQLQPQPLNGYKIIDALIGAGDFSNWVSIISMMNPLLALPLTATFFVPENNAVNSNGVSNLDPFAFPYHIVPQRLTFSELLLLKTNTRLPTLLPGKSILITYSSSFNFSVDNIRLTRPDIYTTPNIAVHGVGSVLDYTTYGNGLSFLPNPTTPPSLPPPSVPIGQAIMWKSDAACLCREFPMLSLAVCVVLVYKIQRNFLAC